jgi:hypothetical protein
VDENKVLSIGVFDFRMYARSNGCYPQFRLNSGNQTIYWQVTDYWDMNTSLEAANLTDTGYSFSLVSSLNTDPTAWNDLKGSVNPTRKSEVWMADLQNDHMYQIQFVILRSGPFTSSPTTYVIIAKRY